MIGAADHGQPRFGPGGSPTMSRLWDRVTFGGDGPSVGGVAVADVIARLEAGESWDALAKSLGIGPADIVAAIAAQALGDEDSLGPALVQSRPRRPGLLAALSEPALAAAIPECNRGPRLALSAGLLQVNDFWDASHNAAQEADDLGERWTSAYWHEIAHRREPDFGNAAYWARRVAQHPVFAAVAEAAGDPAWYPARMIELCSSARPGSREEVRARKLQRIEMLRLLEASAGAVDME
jgi:hypothetical protein